MGHAGDRKFEMQIEIMSAQSAKDKQGKHRLFFWESIRATLLNHWSSGGLTMLGHGTKV